MNNCICNCCGNQFDAHKIEEFNYSFGYFSKRDMDKLHLKLCNECLDRFIDKLILECKLNPIERYEDTLLYKSEFLFYPSTDILKQL